MQETLSLRAEHLSSMVEVSNSGPFVVQIVNHVAVASVELDDLVCEVTEVVAWVWQWTLGDRLVALYHNIGGHRQVSEDMMHSFDVFLPRDLQRPFFVVLLVEDEDVHWVVPHSESNHVSERRRTAQAEDKTEL